MSRFEEEKRGNRKRGGARDFPTCRADGCGGPSPPDPKTQLFSTALGNSILPHTKPHPSTHQTNPNPRKQMLPHTTKDINVPPPHGPRSEHHAMRVESGAGDGGGAGGGEEWGVRLDGVEEGAVGVEEGEGVVV